MTIPRREKYPAFNRPPLSARRAPNRRFSDEEVRRIRGKETIKDLAVFFDCAENTIWNVKRRKTYADVT